MGIEKYFANARRRNLAVLALSAVLSLVLAAVALEWRAERVSPKNPPHRVFAELEGNLNKAARIRIVSKKDGVIDAAFLPMKGWVLTGRGNYPASFETVRQTLTGLATLETIEPKTANPEWFRYVDLDAPPKGAGVAITVSDAKGKVLAALIVGKSEEIGDPSGAVGLFVRRAGDNRSWLVRSLSDLRTGLSDWMDKKIFDIDRARIAEVSFHPVSGPAFAVRRASAEAAEFTLDALPQGRSLVSPTAPEEAGAALGGLTFDDAKPHADLDFEDGAHVVARTFDGLIVGLDVVRVGEDYWARIYANAAPGNPDAGKEARAINAKAYDWAFKLPAYKGAQLTTTLESMLKPK
jgi:hypothetical protein